jgi:hypothetical protein
MDMAWLSNMNVKCILYIVVRLYIPAALFKFEAYIMEACKNVSLRAKCWRGWKERGLFYCLILFGCSQIK